MPRRIQDEDVPRSLPWLNTYADMVTLLWTFFILLFSLSVLSQEKFQGAMGSVQSAFGILNGGTGIFTEPASTNPNLNAIAQELAALETQGEGFKEELEKAGLGGKVSIEMEERGLVLRFADSILFDSGSADIRPDARELLLTVGRLIKPSQNSVRIEGHTDNLPISTERFPSNWELSTGRAASVVRFLIDNLGFDPKKLEAAGYGEERPIASNSTPEGRQKNRRVDILLLRPSLTQSEPSAMPEQNSVNAPASK